jgi:hypothetical protein
MGLKICFYASVKNERNEEVEVPKKYEREEGNAIYKIEAGEVCSEFIARYFNKVEEIPNLLFSQVAQENYKKLGKVLEEKELKNGIYKAKINQIEFDCKENYEIKAFKESKRVREKLLNKYNELDGVLKQVGCKPKIDIYALFEV